MYVRPTDSVDVMGNYFLPGVLGGDHALKFGFKYRNDIAHTESMYGGDAYARFRNGVAGRGADLPPRSHRVRPPQPELLRAGQLHRAAG